MELNSTIHKPTEHRPTVAVVKLDALARNYQRIAAHVGVPVMPIVKANAYGHGLIECSRAFLAAGAQQLGVALLEEGIALRRAGIECPVLVLGGILGDQIPQFLAHRLMLTASSIDKLEQIQVAAEAARTRATVHLKIDTGMGRIGVRPSSAPALFERALALPRIDVEGVFTHFANSDLPEYAPTQQQLDAFLGACHWISERALPWRRHAANSGAVAQFAESWLDMVRPGILCYGVYPSTQTARKLALEPVLSLHSQVVYTKTAEPGQAISYGSTWRAPASTRIVTVPCGYGDGYMRAMSGQAQVLIAGRRQPIVGRICMDQCMVDVGQQSVHNGAQVVLVGHDGEQCVGVEDLAEWAGTIPYEILTNLNSRIARIYPPATSSVDAV